MIPNQIHIITEGLRIYLEGRHRKQQAWKRFSGGWREICHQIVESCWNGRYFQSSTGHFRQFYARDFGLSMPALTALGYGLQCTQTLRYALYHYSKANRIRVAITPSGRPFDFPNAYSPDSVAHLFRSLAILKDKGLIEMYFRFLQQEINRFFETVVDPQTGLANRHRHFGGMKDYAIRDSSCYDSTMIAVLNGAIKKLKVFENPLKDYHLKKEIIDAYWRDDHFTDDQSGKDILTGDANIAPFYYSVINDSYKQKKAIRSIQNAKLDKPFPLSYDPIGETTQQVRYEWFVPGWERGASWSNIGIMYLELLKHGNRGIYQQAILQYHNLIEHHGTLFECYTPDYNPYQSRWYHADEGMVWAVNLIEEQHNAKE